MQQHLPHVPPAAVRAYTTPFRGRARAAISQGTPDVTTTTARRPKSANAFRIPEAPHHMTFKGFTDADAALDGTMAFQAGMARLRNTKFEAAEEYLKSRGYDIVVRLAGDATNPGAYVALKTAA